MAVISAAQQRLQKWVGSYDKGVGNVKWQLFDEVEYFIYTREISRRWQKGQTTNKGTISKKTSKFCFTFGSLGAALNSMESIEFNASLQARNFG